MERNREGRRGSMAASATTTMNGGGPSRRRQKRSSNRRVPPEDDDGGGGRTEMYRSSSRSKKKRRTRRDDSSEESFGEDEEDYDDYVRFPTTTSSSVTNQPPPASSSSSSMHQNQNHHAGRSFWSKPIGPPAPLSWSVAEEIIGVPVPRKARSSYLKRSQESIGGGGGGRGGELLMHRRQSTSPSSSNASVRKQKKPISGPKHHRQPTISKLSSSTQEIEIEVAEVLFGMTRQSPLSSSSRQESKSGASSPAGSFSPPMSPSQPSHNLNSSTNSASAPKRKRPRPQFEKEGLATRIKMELLPPKADDGLTSASPSRQEKEMAAVSHAVGNDGISGSHLQESATRENGNSVPERKEAEDETTAAKPKEASCSNLDEATAKKAPREEKFSIDLMAPPTEGLSEYLETVKKLDIMNGEIEKPDKSLNQEATTTTECSSAREGRNAGKCMADDIHSKNKCTTEEKQILEPEQDLDLEKKDKDGLSHCGSSKGQQQTKQQPEEPRHDPKPSDKNGPSIVSAHHPASLQLTMPIAGWPGNFPHFGYMSQVPSLPAVMPMDGSSVTSKASQPPHFFPPQKRKRCATHCYIAQTIRYNQQIVRMNPFWPPAAAGTLPIYGAKPCNPNVMLQSENPILSNLLQQGSFPGRSLGQLQDKASPAVATYAGASAKEKSATAAATNSTLMEAYRKQFLLQQTPHPGSAAAAPPPPPPNMLHRPAFIFPTAQQPAATTPSVAAKSNEGICNARPSAPSVSSIAAGSGPSVHPVTTMSFNYPTLQANDAQYLALLQNYGYPFPTPTHVGGGPLPYRGANPAPAMPFFTGSFYSSPMLHPSQQQQPSNQQQHPAPSRQGHHNPSTPSGSSSSQEHHSQQSQRAPGGAGAAAAPAGGNSHSFPASKQPPLHLLPPQARQPESEAACEDRPSPADSTRTSQAQKSMYGKFAVIAPAAAALPSNGAGGSGCHKEKQQPQQNQANLTPSHAYAMSFAAAAAASGGAPGIDFSSMVQNHAFFQSLPEAARHHGYQQIAAATAAAAQAAQHKKSHHEDGKSGGDPGTVNANVSCEEGKMMISTSKAPGSSAQHSLSFSRPDNDHTRTTLPVNSSCITEGSSRNANLMQLLANGGQTSNRSSIAAPASSSAAVTAVTPANPTSGSLNMQFPQQQQEQRHLIQLQQQKQQQLQLQQQMSLRPTKKTSSHNTNNTIVYSDRMPSGSTMTRFPQGAGFPPSVIQGASAGQSPQGKASGRAVAPGPGNSATSTSSSAKNQLPQQQQQHQGRTQLLLLQQQQQQQQQALLNSNAHQTQISFGLNLAKPAGGSGQTHIAGGSSNSSLTSAAAMAAGSRQNSVLKSGAGNGGSAGGNGSQRASTSSKSGPGTASSLQAALPMQQPTPAAKNSSSTSSSPNLKSPPPASNWNMNSILGHPHTTPAASNSSSTAKFQQHFQQQQSSHQPQLFFSQSSQSNAAATSFTNFYQLQQQQQRQSEQQSQQQKSLCTSSSLTLASSSATTTTDPAKAAAAAAGGTKGLTPVSGSPGAFPYIHHAISSSVSVKPSADPKAAAAPGN